MEQRSINGLLKPTENWIEANENNEAVNLDTVYLGHYVIVSYLQIFKTGANTQANVFGKDRVDVGEKGEFRFFLPEKELIYEQNVTLEIFAPDGEFLAKVRTSYGSLHDSKASSSQKDKTAPYIIEVNPKLITIDEPDTEVKFYKKISGKLIDSSAQKDVAGLQIIIMAKVSQDDKYKAVLSAQLDSSGYFYSQLEKHQIYDDVYAFIAGLETEKIPIALEEDELPKHIILVADLSDLIDEDIKKSVANLPNSSDLVKSSAFSQDLGGTCVDFTVPNRSLEEHSFFHTVRTTEPEIRSYTIGKSESRDFKQGLDLHTSNAFNWFEQLIDSWNSVGLYYYEESEPSSDEKVISEKEVVSDTKMIFSASGMTTNSTATKKFSYTKQLKYLSSSINIASSAIHLEFDHSYLDSIIDAIATYKVNQKKLEQLHKKVQEAYCLKNVPMENRGYCENINADSDESDVEVIDDSSTGTSMKEIDYVLLKQDIQNLLDNIKNNAYVLGLEGGDFYISLKGFLERLNKLTVVQKRFIESYNENIEHYIRVLHAGDTRSSEQKEVVINYLVHIMENINAGNDNNEIIVDRNLKIKAKKILQVTNDKETCADGESNTTGIICLMKEYEKLKETLANKAIFTLGEIMEIGTFYDEFERSIKYFSSLLEEFNNFYRKCNSTMLFVQNDYFIRNYSNIKAEFNQLKLSIRLAKNRIDKIELEYVHNHPGRRNLSVDTSIDWDETPTVYENTTISHGHILQFKQVWKADGYSLGDLLYSLPLAPCQEKQIAIVDWDRKEEASRTEGQSVSESLSANLSRDRDIDEIINSTFNENVNARSSNKTSSTSGGGSGGLGFSMGGFTLGASGGVSHSGSSSVSSASQASSRNLAGNTLNRLQDNVSQSASSVRSQRNTVIQAVGQNESVNIQTEVIKNNNHCHSMTVEYFEVLKHYAVEQELVDAQECLFVPLPMSNFDHEKVLRWKNTLRASMYGKALLKGFDAIERIESSNDSGLPLGSYAEDTIEEITGYFNLSFDLQRPYIEEIDEATETVTYDLSSAYPWYIGRMVFSKEIALSPEKQDAIFEAEYAPKIVAKFIETLGVYGVNENGDETDLDLDVTLMSHYKKGVPLKINVAMKKDHEITRSQIKHLLFRAHTYVKESSKVMLHSAYIHYRTNFIGDYIVRNGHINNDIISTKKMTGAHFNYRTGVTIDYDIVTDAAYVYTPLSKRELVNPREEDRKAAEDLISFLNEHLEMAHKTIWSNIDASRLFGLLDGYIAPNAKGRSVASVVENKVMGIVGNNLVLKVVPGERLDPMLRGEDLLEHYKPDIKPDPFRISVPTKGVYAESVMGKCNSCEEVDETRHWRYDDAPCATKPTAIETVSAASRRSEVGDLQVKDLPTNIINMQTPQAAPDPSGLLAAYGLLGKGDAFKDMTGLQGTQANTLGALQTTSKSVTDLASISKDFANLAVMANQGKNVSRQVSALKKLRKDGDLTEKQFNKKLSAVMDTPINAAKSLTTQNPMDVGAGQVAQKQAEVALNANKTGANVELEHVAPDGTKTKTKITQPENVPINISSAQQVSTATNQGSSPEEATIVVDAFSSRTSELKFNVTRDEVTQGLRALIANPDSLNQGEHNICGPAAMLHSVLQRDPKFVANFIINLAEKGKANFGPRDVDPDSDLKEQKYEASWTIDAATWIAASSLRDNENWWFDYEGTPDENASGITTPGEIKDWLEETGLYSDVTDDVNLVSTKDTAHATNLRYDEDVRDNILLINASILYAENADPSLLELIGGAFPTHYVVLASEVKYNSGNVQFDVWTYGERNKFKIDIPQNRFEDNYYGAVIAQV